MSFNIMCQVLFCNYLILGVKCVFPRTISFLQLYNFTLNFIFNFLVVSHFLYAAFFFLFIISFILPSHLFSLRIFSSKMTKTNKQSTFKFWNVYGTSFIKKRLNLWFISGFCIIIIHLITAPLVK